MSMPPAPPPESPALAGQDPAPDQAPAPHRGLRPRLGVLLAALLTIVLGGFGAWAAAQAHSLRSEAAGNRAVVDAGATAAVRRQISQAVHAIFSYSYADTARTRAAAQRVLTGPAIAQYNRLFTLVQRQAPAQKLVVNTTVTNIGVEMMTSDRARLLVFADQQDTRAGTRQSSYAGTMFAVTAVLQHGGWKIENIDTFTGR